MISESAAASRSNPVELVECDFAVIGGGLAGVCAAITAARQGLRVTLVNDRPVLGGNASSEVRLWVLGATSHMGNNNRWAREGGVIDEILVENLRRNPEGNPLIFDTVILDLVCQEPNIRLLLNTAVYEVKKRSSDSIESVGAFCSQNGTHYQVKAPLFCDASGDGIVGFLSGAAFRMGAENAEEFGELFAPDESYGELLGHSLYFYTKDVGRPVEYTAPSFALKDITTIPRYRSFNANEHGCLLWWIEYGGRLDTVHQSEEIKWELWRIVYGVWDYIKNSGEFPDAETQTLEWVGQIPGKRESRRFEGDVMLTQQDIVEQRRHDDAVSFGGWSIDLHPADGVYSSQAPCDQWHSKGVYQIPYRALYSRNIENLFLAGRIISSSHVAFGSTRVMGTCAHSAQAVGMAAAMCLEGSLTPRLVAAPGVIERLQSKLLGAGQYIPCVVRHDPLDLAQRAVVSASSELELSEIQASGKPDPLNKPLALVTPLAKGKSPVFTIFAEADETTQLDCELRTCSCENGFTPDVTLAHCRVSIAGKRPVTIATPHSRKVQSRTLAASGEPSVTERLEGSYAKDASGKGSSQPVEVRIEFDCEVQNESYAFLCLMANENVSVFRSDQLVTGLTAVRRDANLSVSKGAVQQPPPGIGIEKFEFWRPERRPIGRLLAAKVAPSLPRYEAANVTNGIDRPTNKPNAWVAAWDDPQPRLTLTWDQPQTIGRVEISFDTDHDHSMETVLMNHPERVTPHCVRSVRLLDDAGRTIASCQDNYQTRRTFAFEPRQLSRLHIEVDAPSSHVPAALFGVRCYAQ